MKLKCDNCGRPIKGAEDGWVELLADRNGKAIHGSLRIVHSFTGGPAAGTTGCQYPKDLPGGQYVMDLPLDRFTGEYAYAVRDSFIRGNGLPEAEVGRMMCRIRFGDRE